MKKWENNGAKSNSYQRKPKMVMHPQIKNEENTTSRL